MGRAPGASPREEAAAADRAAAMNAAMGQRISGGNASGSLRPTALDLLAGAGGLTLGLRQARFRVLGSLALDPLAAATYRAKFPRIHLWRMDIRHLSIAACSASSASVRANSTCSPDALRARVSPPFLP